MHLWANEGPLYSFRDILDRALDAPYQLSQFQNLRQERRNKFSVWEARKSEHPAKSTTPRRHAAHQPLSIIHCPLSIFPHFWALKYSCTLGLH
jgi:hypothetical protein